MLRNAKELERCELRARDGKIGHVHDLFFDDRQWTVRYVVVDTGTWLNSRKVLLSPIVVTGVDVANRLLAVDLSQAQVRNSPTIDAEQPVSREQETALMQYYNWPSYWGVAGFPDVGFSGAAIPMIPIDLAGAGGIDDPVRSRRPGVVGATSTAEHEHHLRSVRAVTGHSIEAIDGGMGHVDDFLLDDVSWAIRFLVVDTRHWWPGKKVLVAPEWISSVGWNEAKVHVDLTREAVKSSPAYDAAKSVTPEYSQQLHEHYGRMRHHSL